LHTFYDLFLIVLKAVPMAVVSPATSYVFWIIALLVFSQYRRVENMERGIYGVAINRAFPQTVQAMGYGMLGGVLGTLIMVYIGVSPYTTSFAILLALALSLYLLHPRFVCFSYAAAIISLVHLATGWPDIYVPGLVAIVAVLHVTESFLMAVSGASCNTPLYVKNRAGHVVPGFSLQRFWPIPLAVLVLGSVPELGEAIPMPDWWPLVAPPPSIPLDAPDLAFIIFPIVAALGYSDLAVTLPPKAKCHRSAVNLAIYSAVLLCLAVASSRVPALQWVAALFSGLGHEAVVHLGNRRELRGNPYLVPAPEGIKIMGAIPGMPAHDTGLRGGDVILAVDGDRVNSRHDLEAALDMAGDHVHLLVANEQGKTRYLRSGVWGKSLGIIPLPRPGDRHHVEIGSSMPLKRLIGRIKGSGTRS
jgi:hypothetical protein